MKEFARCLDFKNDHYYQERFNKDPAHVHKWAAKQLGIKYKAKKK